LIIIKVEDYQKNFLFKNFLFLAKTGSSTIDLPCSIVYAGLEPIDFINLFPKWTVNIKARQQNQLVRIF